MPEPNDPFDFIHDASAGASRFAKAAQGLNLTDMILGKEKENIFHLLPDEDVLAEVTIHHKHFVIVDRGITRLTLTGQRLLYTSTRIFSPLYWLLVALFPPLILYYAIRIAINRNGSVLLSSVDSVEKRYFPNWSLFVIMLIIGDIIAGLCSLAIKHTVTDSPAVLFSVSYILYGLLAVGLLILLLASRGPWMEIRSGNNKFPVSRRPGDIGGDEQELDVFFQRVNIEVARAKMQQTRAYLQQTSVEDTQ